MASRRSQRTSATSKSAEADDGGDNDNRQPLAKKSKTTAAASASKKKSGKEEQQKSSKKESPEKKLKSVVIKGRAPVDEECPLAKSCHVFFDEGGLWDTMLNQSNIQNNNNKFYLIQLLQEDSGSRYHIWMRWGRVGYKGQTSLTGCQSNLEQAKKIFEKKFADKTKNAWSDREDFEKVPGKYDLVKLDYLEDEVNKEQKSKNSKDVVDAPKSKPPVKTPESKLQSAVQELIRLICDVKTMEQTVVEMQYDTKKSPLGKITTEQIKAGYEALKRISELIDTPQRRSELIEACNDFYTRIPHYFGMSTPTLIKSLEEVKGKIQLLEALGDIQVAMKVLNDKVDLSMNPVDRQYKQLACDISHLAKDSKDFRILSDYIQSTHAKTHSMYTMEVQEIFECKKDSDALRFKDCGNRTLLFHGSRMSNWAGILSQGLRIAPPEAPVTGYMFGKGIYFADMSSKSANYCWTTPSKNMGLLLMCEVALGKTNDLVNACYTANELPKGTDSVRGLGMVAPDPKRAQTLSDGTLVPMGPGQSTKVKNDSAGGFTLNYNEYIVYDVSQVKMRYLAQIKFNYFNK